MLALGDLHDCSFGRSQRLLDLANLALVSGGVGSRGLLLLALVAVAAGCGHTRPARFVLEQDVADFHYRRYQQVADVELPIPENPAMGHTATYVRGGEPLRVLPVFVTSYERSPGLCESVRQRLRSMDEYELGVKKLGREHVWQMRGESGDVWLLWVSGKQLVKVGAPSGEPQVPNEVAEAYLMVYPSDLDRRGHVRRGAESAGAAVAMNGTPSRDED